MGSLLSAETIAQLLIKYTPVAFDAIVKTLHKKDITVDDVLALNKRISEISEEQSVIDARLRAAALP